MKGTPFGKEEVKMSLLTDGMIVYIENPMDHPKKMLKLIIDFSEVVRHKISKQKSVVFLYANKN